MEKSVVAVRIRWLSPEEGGRKTMPLAGYMPRIEFHDFPFPDGESWSIVLTALETNGMVSVGSMRFLSDHAPVEALHRGGAFELFEGGRKVAEGIVLAPVTMNA
jgi:hypothetical protein